jgi:hypothetical protein
MEGEAVPNRPNDWYCQRLADDHGSEHEPFPMRYDTLMAANKSILHPRLRSKKTGIAASDDPENSLYTW